MKFKPIKQGYKFWALSCAETGYVWVIWPWTPGSTIADGVRNCIMTLPDRVRRSYIVTMDNLFTVSGVMEEFRSWNVHVLGTTRRNMVPRVLREGLQRDKRFNTVYYVRRDDYVILRWIDNNEVFMVSSLHDPAERIMQERRRPRRTATNAAHLTEVWGNNARADIPIPLVVHQYNNWMNGVDVSDQLVQYYAPIIRCYRNWLPIFLQGLQVMRVNAWIVHKMRSRPGEALSHKEFVMALAMAYLRRAAEAKAVEQNRRVQPHRGQPLPMAPEIRPPRRRRMTQGNARLPETRLHSPRTMHQMTFTPGPKGRGRCVYCLWMRACLRAADEPFENPVRCNTRCSHCKVFICKWHFTEFHDEPEPESNAEHSNSQSDAEDDVAA